MFLYRGEKIDYSYIGGKRETVLFLHGWGGNKFSFNSTINLLKSRYNILTLTLPTTQPTQEVWKLEDYVNLVLNLLKLYNTKSVYIVCHSFGFRLVSLLDKQIEIKKLIVTGGAGLKTCNVFKEIESNNKQIFLKKCPFLFNQIASPDYISLSKTNKQTFKNIVSVNTKNLIYFNCPLLLFWGKLDKETPYKFAKIIKKTNNAKLISTNSGHFAYINENSLFNNEVIKFLKS